MHADRYVLSTRVCVVPPILIARAHRGFLIPWENPWETKKLLSRLPVFYTFAGIRASQTSYARANIQRWFSFAQFGENSGHKFTGTQIGKPPVRIPRRNRVDMHSSKFEVIIHTVLTAHTIFVDSNTPPHNFIISYTTTLFPHTVSAADTLLAGSTIYLINPKIGDWVVPFVIPLVSCYCQYPKGITYQRSP